MVSAHRMPEEMLAYGKEAAGRGLEVIIAGAGGAAHLPGMLASVTPLPVIGVPGPAQAPRRPGLAALDRADAGRGPGRDRGGRQRAQRRPAGRPDPGGVRRRSCAQRMVEFQAALKETAQAKGERRSATRRASASSGSEPPAVTRLGRPRRRPLPGAARAWSPRTCSPHGTDGRQAHVAQWLVEGRASALFAVLAGVSLALMSRRTNTARPGRPCAAGGGARAGARRARDRAGGDPHLLRRAVPARAAVPGAAGPALFALGRRSGSWPRPVPPSWCGRTCRCAGAASPAFDQLADPGHLLSELLFTGYYPCLTWLAYLLLGMAIGRCDLRSRSVHTGCCWRAGGIGAGVRGVEVADRAAVGAAPAGPDAGAYGDVSTADGSSTPSRAACTGPPRRTARGPGCWWWRRTAGRRSTCSTRVAAPPS